MSGPAFGLDPRVDFVVGGVQKGGTTSLDRMLRDHPAVAMGRQKEPHWFDDDERFASGMPDPAPYHAMWGERLFDRLCGDATPSYLWWPGAVERIRTYNPAMRWILLLRDPSSRAYSHWNMRRQRDAEPLDFAAALDAEPERLRNSPPRNRRGGSYADRGFYARQIARLWESFPREQTLILKSTDLRGNPGETLAAITDFLGLEPLATFTAESHNEGEYDEPMRPEDRRRLVRLYDADIRELESMLGWDLSEWRR
ncbi:MAG: sulfotransferase domain-containing protein [Burkholderiales bacterium]